MENQTENKEPQKRQIAFKVLIGDIIDSDFVKEEGWTPNYIKLPDGTKASRVNVIGAVIDKQDGEFPTITIDDGSRNILVRSFDSTADLKPIGIGETVLIIGRPREYNQQRYVLPEIIKPVNMKWLKVRKTELGQQTGATSTVQVYDEETVEESRAEEPDVFKVIRELDSGEGASVEEVISKIGKPEIEKAISNMIKVGEIFENKPGRVKILE